MNPNLPESDRPCPADEALADALLREHSRLGSLDDEVLLANIRLRTVAKPVAAGEPRASSRVRSRTSAREWVQIAAIVALSLTVLGLFFSQRRIEKAWRTEQAQHSMAPVDPEITATVQSDVRSKSGPTLAQSHPGVVSKPDIRTLTLADLSVEAQSISHLAPGLLVYEGDVVFRHPDFVIKADRIDLTSSGPNRDDPVKSFVARGEGVEIEKRSANGAVEIARAAEATYDADAGRLILAGGPTLSAGNSFVQPITSDGVIVLRPDGYEVIEH